uniref:Secreted protein n=2 Tax=Opuntia streptacantha TaxID=393608 RepID=A0A7C9DGR7_OPUST
MFFQTLFLKCVILFCMLPFQWRTSINVQGAPHQMWVTSYPGATSEQMFSCLINTCVSLPRTPSLSWAPARNTSTYPTENTPSTWMPAHVGAGRCSNGLVGIGSQTRYMTLKPNFDTIC